jgi:hypothetical protein
MMRHQHRVLNLVPDKPAGSARSPAPSNPEARLAVSDIALQQDLPQTLPPAIASSLAACVGGTAGLAALLTTCDVNQAAASVRVHAIKPASPFTAAAQECAPSSSPIALHAQSHGTILAARYADTSLAISTGHIMCSRH